MQEALVKAGARPVRGATGSVAAVLPWRVVHTKSRQEKALAESLGARGVEFYLPLVRRVRYHGRRKVEVRVPLFPGYLFQRSSVEEAYLTERTDRVVRVLPVADQVALEADLAALRLAIERDVPLEATDYLAEGVEVEVSGGPLRGLRGVVERGGMENRLVLRVRMLGRAAELEIDRTLLEPVD